MADGESRFSPKLVAGAVVVLVLVALLSSTYLGGVEDNTTPPSAAYEALQAGEPLPEGYGLPAERRGPATKGSSRLAADESDLAEPQNDEDEGQQKKRRGNSKKRDSKQSKPDEHGVYHFDDGRVDYSKTPPG